MEATLEQTLADVLVDVALVKYRPGDVLVLRCKSDRLYTAEHFQRIKSAFESEFEGQLKLMIISDDMNIHGLLRADNDAG